MNSSQYTAHPDEQEILLVEGAPMAVMAADEVLIDNSKSGDAFWADFNGSKITIIYMFHATKWEFWTLKN